MAKTVTSPGVIVIFNDKIYYKKLSSLAEVQSEIDAIKSLVVAQAGYTELDPGDSLELRNAETDDIKALLSHGITIRPMGR